MRSNLLTRRSADFRSDLAVSNNRPPMFGLTERWRPVVLRYLSFMKGPDLCPPFLAINYYFVVSHQLTLYQRSLLNEGLLYAVDHHGSK